MAGTQAFVEHDPISCEESAAGGQGRSRKTGEEAIVLGRVVVVTAWLAEGTWEWDSEQTPKERWVRPKVWGGGGWEETPLREFSGGADGSQ